MLVKSYSAAVSGIDAEIVTCEVNCTSGIRIMMVGLPDASVKESRDRIQAAVEQVGLKFPRKQIVINLSPADIRKEGAHYDLPLSIAILASAEKIASDRLKDYLLVGELSLDGYIKPIKGSLPIAIRAREKQFKGIILPTENAKEAAVVNNLEVYGADHLKEVIDFMNGKESLKQTIINTREDFFSAKHSYDFDFDEVKGQEEVKRALEVAAAGGHNLIMIGPPGAGKSMMAKRVPTILPPLTLSEALETTKIHSVAHYRSEKGLITIRPFRAPHHTISPVALIGGGSNPLPGEISMANNGVLFLDELPEFSRQVLEVMRQPLEDRRICIARAKSTVTYPASFMLVASMNPCPCGYYNHPNRECVCGGGVVKKYMNKISGPLLDRIDIQVEIVPVPFEDISCSKKGESSEVIRQRVIAARKIQEVRFAEEKGVHCNAQMNSRQLNRYASPDQDSLVRLKLAMNTFSLSARAYDRILKVARTIADLEQSDAILVKHINEAIRYRNLDRENWCG